MIDISQDDFGEKISSSQRELTNQNIQEVSAIYHQLLNHHPLSPKLPAKIIPLTEIKENNYILVPARYLSPNETDLTPQQIDQKILTLTTKLKTLINQQDLYHQDLKKLLAEVEEEIEN